MRLLSLALGGLFFVGLWTAVRSAGGWRPAPHGTYPVSPPSVVVLAEHLTHGVSEGELLFVSAAGQLALRRRIPGSLGLMAQWQTLAVTPQGALFVAVGRGFWVLPGRRGAYRFIASPEEGAAALQVYQWEGHVYAVTEKADAAAWLWSWEPKLGRFGHGTAIPWGLTRFLPGRTHPWLLLLRPHSAEWWWPGQQAAVWNGTPEGTGSAIGGRWLPVLDNNQFQLWFEPRGGRRTIFTAASTAQDILAISPGAPLWLATVGGMVPLSRRGPEEERLVRWPGPLQTTVTVVNQGSWDLVADGPDQGWWFNAATGKFSGYLAPVRTGGWMPLTLVVWPR